MERKYVIQTILDTFVSPAYLEIGVSTGATFHAVSAHSKSAVDPVFSFDVAAAREQNTRCRYFQEPSDCFFSRPREETFDVIFIDGLHTFEQTLRDLNNSIICLRQNGVIIIDDVIPNSFASAISDMRTMHAFKKELAIVDGAWMGDVYKLVFFLADYLTSFRYATVAENRGQTLLWKGARLPYHSPALSLLAISQLDFADAVTRKDVFQLKSLADIKKDIVADRH